MNTSQAPGLDLALVHGFRFSCRVDCGLCCFAEPRVEPPEASRLIQLDPAASFRKRGADRYLSARPEGGACQFLVDLRCRWHADRPQPCREYPVTVHLGRRIQASLVLSCPGIGLDPLTEAAPRAGAPLGLDGELRAVMQRLGPETERRRRVTERRGRKVARQLESEGRWQEDAEVRAELDRSLPLPGPSEFPVADPPSTEDGLEQLPLYFDGRVGPVAIARALGGWELLEMASTGGGRSLGVVVPPDRPVPIDPAGSAMLEGYLRYMLDRDAFLGAVHLEMLEGTQGTVRDWAGAELRALGAEVVSRAAVRAKLDRGSVSDLRAGDIERGIRATDQDWLDRPSWGDRL